MLLKSYLSLGCPHAFSVAVIGEFHALRIRIREDYKNTVARRFYAVTGQGARFIIHGARFIIHTTT